MVKISGTAIPQPGSKIVGINVVNGDNDAPDGGQSQQEEDNYRTSEDNIIRNSANAFSVSQIHDVPDWRY
jgi:hypothetical protein